ncbi:hypothetical protein [Streptomyces odontomachi]|uniref:hypothetical protein n=1 Tax=Streptomyces odontomachi TaxID=2944940 RepID=UPI00210897FA|nr:hypothetical protein [Streptomyces sp. ODS25]
MPEVIDALVALGQQDVELVDVVVTDGPEIGETGAQDWLLVGFDGDPAGDFLAAQSAGGWSDLSTGREEQFQVTIAAIASRGDGDVRTARVRAYEIGARVENWLRADPSIGLRSLEAAIETTALVQDQTNQGVQARLLLTVAGRAFT